MKRITAFVLICVFVCAVCSCTSGQNKSGDTAGSSQVDKSDRIALDEIKNTRPQWEALLYAAHVAGDTDSPAFRAYAYAYILTYYGFGVQTEEHSDKASDNVTVQREDLETLAKALFGADAVFADSDAEELFSVSGDTFTLKEPLEKVDAVYSMSGVGIDGKSISAIMAAEGKESLHVLFERAEDGSPYTLYARIDVAEKE